MLNSVNIFMLAYNRTPLINCERPISLIVTRLLILLLGKRGLKTFACKSQEC